MTFINVSLRYKGEHSAVESYDTQTDALDECVQRAHVLADEDGRDVLITITPRVHTLTVKPKASRECTDTDESPYPRTGESPSVCEILNRGD